MTPRRLERSTTNRVVAGVCGGLAEYLQVDATLTRWVFALATLFTAGLFILGYIALLFLMPLPGQRAPVEDLWQPQGSRTGDIAPPRADAPLGEASEPVARPAFDPEAEARRQRWIGYALLALGAIFLLSEADVFRFVRWDLIWPVAIIGLGLFFVLRRGRA